jgi:hypothetical protein
VSRLRDLVTLLDPRERERQAKRVEALTELNRALHREVRALRESAASLAELTASVQAQSELLMALRREDAGGGARLARVMSAFDVDRIAAHVRVAVGRAELAAWPFPHLCAPDLFPRAVHDALLDAMPSRVFFAGAPGGRQQIPVPPTLAPVASIVVWEFVLEQIVKSALAPILAERFQLPGVSPAVSGCHIALRGPDREETPRAGDRPGSLAVIVRLARPGNGEGVGSAVYRLEGSVAGHEPAVTVAVRANSALVFRRPAGARVTAIDEDAAGGTERYTLEFDVGAQELDLPGGGGAEGQRA